MATLQNENSASNEAVADCDATLTNLQGSLSNAQADFDAATENYNSNDARLQDEVALFQEVVALYESEVATASDTLKQEVDVNQEGGDDQNIVYAANPNAGNSADDTDFIQKKAKTNIRKKHF